MTKEEVQQRVTYRGIPIPLDKFEWDEKTNTFSSSLDNLVIDFVGISDCTFKTGSDCTFKTGYGCTFNTSSDCTFNTGSYCTFKTGSYCTFKTGSYCTFNIYSDFKHIKTLKSMILLRRGDNGYHIVEEEDELMMMLEGEIYYLSKSPHMFI